MQQHLAQRGTGAQDAAHQYHGVMQPRGPDAQIEGEADAERHEAAPLQQAERTGQLVVEELVVEGDEEHQAHAQQPQQVEQPDQHDPASLGACGLQGDIERIAGVILEPG
jgi:hypothetical protein